MNLLSKLLLVILAVAGLAAATNAEQPAEKPASEIRSQLDALNADIMKVRVLNESVQTAGKADHDFLHYRLDYRGFDLLDDFDKLARKLTALPDDTPDKAEMIKQLVELSNGVGEAIFGRINEIRQRIFDATNSLDALSGGTLISAEAYLQSMENIRVSYYEAMAEHIDTRKVLGLPSDSIHQRLDPMLYIYVETLAGKIEYSAAALKQVRERLSRDSGNTDLKAAFSDLEIRHRTDVVRLQSMIAVLDSLGLDSAEYKAVMLQQASDISISFFSSKSLRVFLRNSWSAFKTKVENNAADIIFRIFLVILILFFSRILSRLVQRIVLAASERSSLNMSTLLKNILVSTSGGLVMGVGFLIALSQVGISLAPMLAGLGVAGFIVGFALQDTLGNFAAGAMILIYRPFDVNDFVEVTGASGLVRKMNLVSTTITTFDNQTLIVPNNKIWGDVIKNVTAQKERRIDLEFGIGYGDDIEHAEKILHEIIESHDKILDEPEANIKLHTLGDSSVNFVVRPWVKTGDYWEVYWYVTREVKLRFDREGISIPFPQRDVHLFNETNGQD